MWPNGTMRPHIAHFGRLRSRLYRGLFLVCATTRLGHAAAHENSISHGISSDERLRHAAALRPRPSCRQATVNAEQPQVPGASVQAHPGRQHDIRRQVPKDLCAAADRSRTARQDQVGGRAPTASTRSTSSAPSSASTPTMSTPTTACRPTTSRRCRISPASSTSAMTARRSPSSSQRPAIRRM